MPIFIQVKYKLLEYKYRQYYPTSVSPRTIFTYIGIKQHKFISLWVVIVMQTNKPQSRVLTSIRLSIDKEVNHRPKNLSCLFFVRHLTLSMNTSTFFDVVTSFSSRRIGCCNAPTSTSVLWLAFASSSNILLNE